MARDDDNGYMNRALELAALGRGKTSPNPMVGAVIVKNGRVVAEGYHRKAGTDHAEVVALKKAGSQAKGATVYVTLEPCCHTGQTGPCTQALIRAGVSRVVFASVDPDPRVKGKGARQLRSAGLKVTSGVLRKEAERLNEVFYGYHRLGRPFVTLKLAMTLDGRIATRTGDSQWITSPTSRRFAHQLRSEADAVLVGAGTLRRDNPSLTVRSVRGRNPFRVVVAGKATLPKTSRLFTDNGDARTIIAASADKVNRLGKDKALRGVTFWDVKTKAGRVDIADLVLQAEAFGLHHLLVEGGSALATAFLKAAMVDRVVFIVAPKLLGAGVSAVGDLGIRKLSEHVPLTDIMIGGSGTDLIVQAYPKWA